jgi:hypothetical protein
MSVASGCWITEANEIRGGFFSRSFVLEGQLFRLSP